MKKFMLTASVVSAFFILSSFREKGAGKDPGLDEVFQKEFSGAESVSWTRQEDLQKATFVFRGHRTIAFFTDANEFVGCIRDIFYDQLPVTVMKGLDQKYSGYDFQEVREIANADGTYYSLVAVSANKKMKLRVDPNGTVTDVEKLSK